MKEAWRQFWTPALWSAADQQVIDRTKRIALRQSPQDVARGVTVFHTRPDCGHYVPLERPEHLNAILRELIGSLQQVGPRHRSTRP